MLDPNPRVPAGILEQGLADFLKADVLSKVTGEPGGSVRRDEGRWEGRAEAAMCRWTPAKAVPAVPVGCEPAGCCPRKCQEQMGAEVLCSSAPVLMDGANLFHLERELLAMFSHPPALPHFNLFPPAALTPTTTPGFTSVLSPHFSACLFFKKHLHRGGRVRSPSAVDANGSEL